MSQISTVVSSTYGTVICPIRGLYSSWSFLTGVRLEITLTGYLINLVGHLQGQEASGQNLDATSVKPKNGETTSSPPPVRHGNLALQPRFRRTLFPTAPRIGPYNGCKARYGAKGVREHRGYPVARAPLLPGATVVLETPPELIPLARPIYG